MPRKSPEQSQDCSRLVLLHRRTHTPFFQTDDDYLFFLSVLAGAVKRDGLQCHGYMLLPKEALFIFAGQDDAVLLRCLRDVTQRYDAYFCRRYQRPEQEWRAKHHPFQASPRAEETHLEVLNGLRYLEMAPVRAGLAQHPADYEWSSYRTHAYGEPSRVLTDHASLRQLHRDLEERRFRYRTLFERELAPKEALCLQVALEQAPELTWSTRAQANPAETALDVA